VHEGWDDKEFLAALREAIQAGQAVPSWFVEAATNAYAWHNIDAERAFYAASLMSGRSSR
jgi:hypothetical protein